MTILKQEDVGPCNRDTYKRFPPGFEKAYIQNCVPLITLLLDFGWRTLVGHRHNSALFD